jgi:hypothetical protein
MTPAAAIVFAASVLPSIAALAHRRTDGQTFVEREEDGEG